MAEGKSAEGDQLLKIRVLRSLIVTKLPIILISLLHITILASLFDLTNCLCDMSMPVFSLSS
jgi:hypothetical protein